MVALRWDGSVIADGRSTNVAPFCISAPCPQTESEEDEADKASDREHDEFGEEDQLSEDDSLVGVAVGPPTFKMRAPGSSDDESDMSDDDLVASERLVGGGRQRTLAASGTSVCVRQVKHLAQLHREKEEQRLKLVQSVAWRRQLELERSLAFAWEDVEDRAREARVEVQRERTLLQTNDHVQASRKASERRARIQAEVMEEQQKSHKVTMELQQQLTKEMARAEQARVEKLQLEAERAQREAEAERLRIQQEQALQKRKEEERAAAELEKKKLEEAKKATEAAETERKKQQQQQQAEAPGGGGVAAASSSSSSAAVKSLASSSTSTAPSKNPDRVKVSPKAQAESETLAQELLQARALVKDFSTQPALKKERRPIDRAISQHLLQITATRSQVRRKANELVGLIRQAPGEMHRTYCLLQICGKCLHQCESQVTKLPSFAFPLAEVISQCCAAFPQLHSLLMATLQEATHLAVPRFYAFNQSVYKSEEEYWKKLGYQEKPLQEGAPPGTKPETETTDEFVLRMSGYIMFQAALLQVPGSGGSRGRSGEAWAWLARLLNHLPVNRTALAALQTFLKASGFRLYEVYGAQFEKLLMTIHTQYVPKMVAHGDVDARAAVTRLASYIQMQDYLHSPEGRDMPEQDESSVVCA